ncbi:hypothetical protein [Lentibacillus sp. CBA3610]|uniref:hypothetical protein n=1 Tax=Lentibacillus sp. CBA3610 TaxID=2518176 RepID=UPI0015962FD6|nr:hypothetical protein [Lentibacillus sp. CBA3610]QKY69884.1 hypothetical protein Len3610_10045 [Lentibacillus sp. CBA3610]
MISRYKDLTTPLKSKKNDAYASEILHHLDQQTPFSYTIISDGKEKTVQDRYRVKFVRIVQKEIRGCIRYFADLVISGYPPSKIRKLGKGNVGLDIGTSTLAVSSLTKAALFNLAEQVQENITSNSTDQRKMDRSKRRQTRKISIEMATIKLRKENLGIFQSLSEVSCKIKELHRQTSSDSKIIPPYFSKRTSHAWRSLLYGNHVF